jgi:uncharacterized protein
MSRAGSSAVKVVYCHGFASGPQSSKGRAVRDHLAARGIPVDLLDMRVPSASGMRLSRMIDVVRGALDGHERALAIGSSLGGLTVARAAERDGRIAGAVLLAPAFRLVERWRARMGEAEWTRWEREGTYPYDDYAAPGSTLHVEFGFMRDAAEVDVGWPDLRVPTAIVHGVSDDTVDIDASRAFAAARPNVRLVEVDDGHQLLGSLDVIFAEIDGALARLG